MVNAVERVMRWLLMAGLSFTLIAACQPRFSSDVARELEGRIVLLRPSRDGLQAVTISREPLPGINLPTRKAVALSPDFTAYVDASAREGVLTLMLVRGGTSRVLISEPIAATHSSRPFRVGWIKPDGTELALLIGDRLMEFRAKGQHVNRRDLADRVRSFAVSDNAIYVVKEHAGRVIEDVRTGRRIEIGDEVKELFASPNANEVLATTASKLVIAIISTDSGKMRKASLRNVEGELRDVIPVGSGQVLVETWDGEERIDGTELSAFSLCGLDGDCSFAFKDDEHVKVHRLPERYLAGAVRTATGTTRTPAPTTP